MALDDKQLIEDATFIQESGALEAAFDGNETVRTFDFYKSLGNSLRGKMPEERFFSAMDYLKEQDVYSLSEDGVRVTYTKK